MASFWESSNPAISDMQTFRETYGGVEANRATIQGIINKTFAMILLALVAGFGGYQVSESMPGIVWMSMIASSVIAIGMFIFLRGNPERAIYITPPYAIIEGFTLGAFTGVLERMLGSYLASDAADGAATSSAAGGLALQAFLITIGVTLAMLGLYYTRIIQPTRRFTAIVSTMVVGIMLTYLLSWPLAMFGIQIPFLSLGSAFANDPTTALIGIGINVLILGVASLTLIIDFGQIEALVSDGRASKRAEWYGVFALLVTLAWIYYEAVKLAFRLAILLNSRD